MMRIPFAVAALAALSFAPITAQQVYGGPDEDRNASTLMVFGQDLMAAVSISYSQPTWKDEYNQQLDSLKGQKLRFGKNWWTTMQTGTSLEIAGKHLDAGSYVLGLECDKDGKFWLLVMGADWAMKNKVMPWATDSWTNETKIALDFGKDALKKSVEKMEVEISADKDNPSKGAFAIRWGKHALTAKVHYAPKASKASEASAEKMKKAETMKKADK